MVSAGEVNTCALDSVAEVECWGSDHGQVSLANEAVGPFKMVSAGSGNTICAIDGEDSISCWPGLHDFGQVSGADAAKGAFTKVAAGDLHVCALDAEASISCWGSDNAGRVSAANDAPGEFTALSVSGDGGFGSTCAIDAEDSIICWGRDNYGQISGPDAAPGMFKSLAAGLRHTCAIDAEDSISCWGLDNYSQVSGPDGAPNKFKAVTAGNFHTCALDTADSISCWGNDGDGRVSGPDTAAGVFGTHPGPSAFAAAPTATITGTARQGETLSADEGTPDPTPDSFAYKWFADGFEISGQTAQTLTLTAAQVGKKISVEVTAIKANYTDASDISAETAAVQGIFAPGPSASISGLRRVGSTLTAQVGSPSPTPTSYSYRWYADGRATSGIARTFKLSSFYAGKRMQVRVRAHRPGYLSASDLSSATARISTLQPKTISMELNDYTVRRGQRVLAEIELLAPGEAWKIVLDGKTLATGVANSRGIAVTYFTIPTTSPVGERIIRAYGAFADRTDPDKITVR